MSEEIAIDTLSRLIDRCKECKFATCENCEISWNEAQSIQGLLDLYNEEKEKNKNSVSKDRINRKIEELKDNCYTESIEFNNEIIEILQELLEE